jgi:hypothetical protein
MTKITTTKDSLPRGKRRGPAAELTLNNAYRAVFKNIGKDAQTDMVLADLAEFSGYYAVSPRSISEADLNRNEGNREVFARILSLLGVSGEDREALRAAAMVELQISSEEGTR